MARVATATGGEVHTLEQIQAEIDAIRTEATSEKEDAAGDSQRADEDFTRYEMFARSLSVLEFPAEICRAAAALRERAVARRGAAASRANAADATLADVGRLEELLAPHMAIREHAQRAGGVAKQEAYGISRGA